MNLIATMPDGTDLSVEDITGISISGGTVTVERTTDQGSPYTFAPTNVTADFIVRQLQNVCLNKTDDPQVYDAAANTVTITSVDVNPFPIAGGTMTFTGSGFATTQPATLECDFDPMTSLNVTMIDDTHFSVKIPNLTSFLDRVPTQIPVTFKYFWNGNSLTLSFTLIFS